VQIGTAQELFEPPRTRFVAEFVGKTNMVDAVAESPNRVARGGLRLHVATTDMEPGASVAISIRPHLIEIIRGTTAPSAGANLLAGTVQRSSYLGDSMDYQVEVDASGVVLRVVGPTPPRVSVVGERMTLRIAPASGVPLGDAREGPP